jgi:hypothetical protein
MGRQEASALCPFMVATEDGGGEALSDNTQARAACDVTIWWLGAIGVHGTTPATCIRSLDACFDVARSSRDRTGSGDGGHQ